jgi:hypothetical protein
MNERIQELMIEAFQSHYGDPVTPVAREKAVELVSGWGEKFAELIIRGCLDQVRDEVQYITDWDKADQVVSTVKKHFGVEE